MTRLLRRLWCWLQRHPLHADHCIRGCDDYVRECRARQEERARQRALADAQREIERMSR